MTSASEVAGFRRQHDRFAGDVNADAPIGTDHVLRRQLRDALRHVFHVDEAEAFLRQNLVHGGDAQNAIDADLQDVARRSGSSPLDACIRSSIATVCKLFLMR